jgi:hypothetical protein
MLLLETLDMFPFWSVRTLPPHDAAEAPCKREFHPPLVGHRRRKIDGPARKGPDHMEESVVRSMEALFS